jgi:outer membrane immunogenic protein
LGLINLRIFNLFRRPAVFSKLFFATAAVALVSSSAFAADLPVKQPVYKAPPAVMIPAYNWSGFYVGASGGYGWGHSDQTDPGIPAPTLPPILIGDGHYGVTGWLAGGTAGYNWQMGQWVFGLEGDYSWSNISGSSQACGPAFALHACGTSLDSFGTFRGRIGYAAGQTGNVLLYVTGGLAVGDVHAWDALTPASGSSFQAGWTVGAGVEFAFAPQWTAKVEYLYIDLGKAQLFNIINTPVVPETVSFNTNLVRAGVNYHFGGPVVAKY